MAQVLLHLGNPYRSLPLGKVLGVVLLDVQHRCTHLRDALVQLVADLRHVRRVHDDHALFAGLRLVAHHCSPLPKPPFPEERLLLGPSPSPERRRLQPLLLLRYQVLLSVWPTSREHGWPASGERFRRSERRWLPGQMARKVHLPRQPDRPYLAPLFPRTC